MTTLTKKICFRLESSIAVMLHFPHETNSNDVKSLNVRAVSKQVARVAQPSEHPQQMGCQMGAMVTCSRVVVGVIRSVPVFGCQSLYNFAHRNDGMCELGRAHFFQGLRNEDELAPREAAVTECFVLTTRMLFRSKDGTTHLNRSDTCSSAVLPYLPLCSSCPYFATLT